LFSVHPPGSYDRISPLDPIDSDFAAAETSIIVVWWRVTASLVLVQCAVPIVLLACTRLKITKAVDRIAPLDPIDSDFAAAETSIIVLRATASLVLVLALHFVLCSPA
jgi:hypothetical protein